MNEPPPGQQLVVVVRRRRDSDGDTTTAARTPIPGCSIQPASSTEDTDARQQTARRFNVFGPPELARARSSDQLEVEGWTVGSASPTAVLGLDGTPMTWPDEHGRPHHVELSATLTTG